MVMELTDQNFDNEISKGNVVVDFWAPWCGPCKVFGPIFEKTSKHFDGKVKFGKVNVDNHFKIGGRYEVMSIPTTIFFKDGKVVEEQVGLMDEKTFTEKLKTVFKV